jgi:hypothetical protein
VFPQSIDKIFRDINAAGLRVVKFGRNANGGDLHPKLRVN